jgi:hypothetical protein
MHNDLSITLIILGMELASPFAPFCSGTTLVIWRISFLFKKMSEVVSHPNLLGIGAREGDVEPTVPFLSSSPPMLG